MAKGQFASDRIPHAREATTVYTLDGVMYVPHYNQTGRYVGPGHRIFNEQYKIGDPVHSCRPTYGASELIRAGARQETYGLWPR